MPPIAVKLLPLAVWVPILDGDPVGAAIYAQHYSSAKSRDRRAKRGTLLFLGPGEKLVLSTPCRRGLFAWRRERYRKDDQSGIECALFSNRGVDRLLSSELISAADLIADQRWPGERHFTFVDERATRQRRSRNAPPGACFIHAGWRPCGTSQRGLHILERVGS